MVTKDRVDLYGEQPFRESCEALLPDALGGEAVNWEQWVSRCGELRQFTVWGEHSLQHLYPVLPDEAVAKENLDGMTRKGQPQIEQTVGRMALKNQQVASPPDAHGGTLLRSAAAGESAKQLTGDVRVKAPILDGAVWVEPVQPPSAPVSAPVSENDLLRLDCRDWDGVTGADVKDVPSWMRELVTVPVRRIGAPVSVHVPQPAQAPLLHILAPVDANHTVELAVSHPQPLATSTVGHELQESTRSVEGQTSTLPFSGALQAARIRDARARPPRS